MNDEDKNWMINMLTGMMPDIKSTMKMTTWQLHQPISVLKFGGFINEEDKLNYKTLNFYLGMILLLFFKFKSCPVSLNLQVSL